MYVHPLHSKEGLLWPRALHENFNMQLLFYAALKPSAAPALDG